MPGARRRCKKLTFRLQYPAADIPRLAAEYLAAPYKCGTAADEDRKMEEAGKRIVGGHGTRQDANIIYGWKSPRRMDLFKKNSDNDVMQALRDAINSKSVRQAVAALTRLEGVGVKMASAFLTAMFPKKHTVLDVRGLEAYGVENGDSIHLYVLYLRASRNMARRLGVELRNLDRANWRWSKKRSKASSVQKDHCCGRRDDHQDCNDN